MAVPRIDDNIKIRIAVIEDSTSILEVIQVAFSEYKAGGQSPALQETLTDIVEDINDNRVLVVENDSKIVGSLRLELKDEDDKPTGYYLKRFAIHPQYQDQGLGTMLFNKAEQIACDENVFCIYLHSTTEDERLVKFYKKLGFQCKAVDNSRGYPRGLWVKKLS